MKKLFPVILLMLTLFAASCASFKKQQTEVLFITPLSDTVSLRPGTIIYALPLTVFTVSVEMERTIDIPGPYARYAEELLGLDNVIMHEDEYWSVKDIKIHSHEEVDPSEFYVIESNTLQQTNILALKESGLILDIGPALNQYDGMLVNDKELDFSQFHSFDLGSDEYYRTSTDTAFQRIKMNEQYIRIPYTVDRKNKLTTEQLAERAAKRLMDLREGKFMVLIGEANVFPQDVAAINELNRMEEEYTALFTGRSFTETKVFTYQVIPRPDDRGKRISLFNFSELTGPDNFTDSNGKSFIIEFIPEQKLKDITVLKKTQTTPIVPVYDKLFYRMPDVVNVNAGFEEELLYKSRKLIYQFGEIMQLPSNYILGR